MGSEWLARALKDFPLTDDVSEYLLGRGAKEETILAEGIRTWQRLPEPSPDEEFTKRFLAYGERLEGMLVTPVRSPRGKLLGFEARSIHEKRVMDFRLPEAKFSPFCIGTRRAMPALWAGGNIWVVEGLFDLTALEWAIPPGDAIIATVRAHLTKTQLEFLRRFCTGQVKMVYDRDETGRKAVTGWIDDTGKKRMGALQLLDGVKLVGVDVHYSGGKDPGEIWDHGGVSAIQATFAQ